MLILLGTTLTASFFDSLNPSAVAQQMLIQALLKNKKHTLFFISGIGLANYLLGLAVFYGIIDRLNYLWHICIEKYPVHTYSAEAIAGIICLIIGVKTLIKVKKCPSVEEIKAPRNALTPLTLFIMGACFCAVELTSALPYFGFLAVLSGYGLSLPYVLAFILLYNFVYLAPLIFLYFFYNRIQGTKLIKSLENILGKVSAYIIPFALIILAVIFIADSFTSFFM